MLAVSHLVDGGWYWPVLATTIAGGIAPAAYFLATFRPTGVFRLRSIDAAGWVFAIFLLYLTAVVRLISGFPTPSAPEAAANLTLGWVVNALLWIRAFHWRRVRRETRVTAVDMRDV